MTKYEYLKDNEEKLKELSSYGFIGLHVLNNISVYECYVGTGNKDLSESLRMSLTADKTKYGKEAVRKIIYQMRKPLPE